MSNHNSGSSGLPNPSIKGSTPDPDGPPGPAGPTTLLSLEDQEAEQKLTEELIAMQQQLDVLRSKAHLLVDARMAIEQQITKHCPQYLPSVRQSWLPAILPADMQLLTLHWVMAHLLLQAAQHLQVFRHSCNLQTSAHACLVKPLPEEVPAA